MGVFCLFSMSFAGSMWYAHSASTWGGESLFQVSERHGYVIQPLLRAFTPWRHVERYKGSLMPPVNEEVQNVQLPNIDPRRCFLTYVCSIQMRSGREECVCVCVCVCVWGGGGGGGWRLSRTQMVIMPYGFRSTYTCRLRRKFYSSNMSMCRASIPHCFSHDT